MTLALTAPAPTIGRKVYFVNPDGFDPTDYLPPALHKYADAARWLVHQVVRNQDSDEDECDGWVGLSSRVMKRVMGKQVYKQIVDSLVAGHVLLESGSYSVGHYPKAYAIHERWLEHGLVRVEATNQNIVDRIHREQARMHQEQVATWLPVHHDLAKMQYQYLTFDASADDILMGFGPNCQWPQICLFLEVQQYHEFRFKVGKNRRVTNCLTASKRELRPAFRLKGEPITEVDIRACQPSLLGTLMEWSGAGAGAGPGPWDTYMEALSCSPVSVGLGCSASSVALLAGLRSGLLAFAFPDVAALLGRVLDGLAPALGPDASEFCDLVYSSDLYDALVRLCSDRGVDLACRSGFESGRDRCKRRFLVDVLAKKGWYPSPFADVFAESFPTVAGFIRWVNAFDYRLLIRCLQRLESWLVIEKVCPLLLARDIPVVTCHDSIYCRERDEQVVRDAFRRVFDEYGLGLQLKP